jgi:2-polyprenyl-3-methyl-5-hydroxy-6-metoxy-1,4-benzoquinol methylase/tRNA A-37 threonylcarbamoyl transferase component Bud32
METKSLDSRNNGLLLVGSGENRFILKSYRKKPFTLKSLKYLILRVTGFDIPIEYKSNKERMLFERQTLLLWREHGFMVPHLHDIPDGSPNHLNEVQMAISFLEGSTLDFALRDESLGDEKKWAIVESVLSEMRERHVHALYTEDHRLVHFDSNMRNIVITKNGPARIDFEMHRRTEKISHSVSREVKKLVLEIANSLGEKNLVQLVEALFLHYGIIHILRLMSDSELKRSFGIIHKWNDIRRKNKNRGIVTKVDLARAIKKHLNRSKKVPDSGNLARTKVELTSWDGKFYQSFDDHDTRGRDMLHRYRVLKLPDSFDGKTVLDIGCNLGRICIDASKRGAKRAVGVDNREDVMSVVSDYSRENELNSEFYSFDLNKGVEALQNTVGQKKFDYIFVLSIWSHVDQKKLWDIINNMCQEVCYFEDNSPSRVKSLERLEQVLRENLKFSVVDFLGFTTDRGVRAVYRLSKKSTADFQK